MNIQVFQIVFIKLVEVECKMMAVVHKMWEYVQRTLESTVALERTRYE